MGDSAKAGVANNSMALQVSKKGRIKSLDMVVFGGLKTQNGLAGQRCRMIFDPFQTDASISNLNELGLNSLACF
jgi:hypothetical protein